MNLERLNTTDMCVASPRYATPFSSPDLPISPILILKHSQARAAIGLDRSHTTRQISTLRVTHFGRLRAVGHPRRSNFTAASSYCVCPSITSALLGSLRIGTCNGDLSVLSIGPLDPVINQFDYNLVIEQKLGFLAPPAHLYLYIV